MVAALKSDTLDNRPAELIIKIRLATIDFIGCLLFFPSSVILLKAMCYLIDLQHFVFFS